MIQRGVCGLICATMVSAALCAAPVAGQESQAGRPVEREQAEGAGQREPKTAEAAALIDRLGDASYTARESAADRLLELGLAAKPALLEGMKHPDLEIRMRAHQILIRAMQGDFERRMQQFIADVDDQQSHDLPGWDGLKKLLGGEPRTRKLFVEMLKHEAYLLEAYQDQPEQLGELLSQRVQKLQTESFNRFDGTQQQIEPATVAAVLFLSSDPRAKSNSVIKSMIYSVLNHTFVREAIRSGSHSRQLRHLLERWVVQTEDSSQPYYGLMLALNYDLQEAGLELGRRYLAEKNVAPMVLQYSAICVGRFGGQKDLAALEPHLDNKTVCHTWSNPQLKKDVIKIEIRDIILAMLVHLTGQSHRDYGYNLLEENPQYLFHLHTYGFLEDDEREAAQAKWKTWRASQQNPNPNAAGK
ncbi:MAG: hypothetical protein J5I93_15595 [Pirellulaceae bacterium]|nr:hypothetical protein [Pirellulaceae bacterium]